MVPGDGSAEESGVTVNLFKKNPIGSKGGGAGTFIFGKKEFTNKCTSIHHNYFQSASVIYCLGFR